MRYSFYSLDKFLKTFYDLHECFAAVFKRFRKVFRCSFYSLRKVFVIFYALQGGDDFKLVPLAVECNCLSLNVVLYSW